MFKKNWTTFMGLGFLLLAFIYLLQMSFSGPWLTPTIKVMMGLVAAGGLLIAGANWILKDRRQLGEWVAGSGVGVLLITFSFAGIYYALWSALTVFLLMLVTTVVLTAFSYYYHLRILMNVSLMSGLIAPLFLRSETDQVFALFLYLLVLNIGVYFVAIQRRWQELYIISFIGTWVLYAVYVIHFDPEVTGLWAMPIRYAVATFLFYLVALTWSGWLTRRSFDGWNIYFGILNGFLFIFWTMILTQDVDITRSVEVLLFFVGFFYLSLSCVVWFLQKEMNSVWLIYGGIGSLLAILGIVRFFESSSYETLFLVYFWLMIAVLLFFFGTRTQQPVVQWMARLTWVMVVVYWYVTTWDTPRGEWLPVYVPFLSFGALAWMLLAVLGFVFARYPIEYKQRKSVDSSKGNRGSFHFFTIVSHLIVGGLLTVQIGNIWEEYALDSTVKSLAYSIVWGLYALTIFFWGTYYRSRTYTISGSIVLLIVALKVLLSDLAGQETVYKIVVLVVLGVISLAFSYLKNRSPVEKNQAEVTAQSSSVLSDRSDQETDA